MSTWFKVKSSREKGKIRLTKLRLYLRKIRRYNNSPTYLTARWPSQQILPSNFSWLYHMLLFIYRLRWKFNQEKRISKKLKSLVPFTCGIWATHRYRPEIPEPAPSLSRHGALIREDRERILFAFVYAVGKNPKTPQLIGPTWLTYFEL